jgi:hypothetical protein
VSLEPDEDQIARFADALFRNADPGTYVHMRALFDDGQDGIWGFKHSRSIQINGSLDPVTDAAVGLARKAARAPAKVVFAPPVATFRTAAGSRESDIANGLTITVDLDANPSTGLRKLEAVLGPATLVVQSGGRWIDPDTGKIEPKLHVHWRLKHPTRSPDEHAVLKDARSRAKVQAQADGSAVPISHPLRWAGSWHRKAEPVLACIVDDGYRPETEIDLHDAVALLRGAGAKAPFTPSPLPAPDRGAASAEPQGATLDEAEIAGLIDGLPSRIRGQIETALGDDSDRSGAVWSIVGSLTKLGYDRAETIAILRRFPAGPAMAKYGPRLAAEVDRILNKIPIVTAAGRAGTAPPTAIDLWDAGDDVGLPPPRGWLLANTFCRRCLSGLVASGGKGKSALRLAQLLSVATGRSLTGERVLHRVRVLFVSLEDDKDELRRRLHAVMLHHNVSPDEVRGWLHLATPIGMKLVKDRNEPGPLEKWLRAKIHELEIDIVCIDPLVKAHGFDENDNTALDYVCTLLTQIAHDCNCAVDILHHEGKANSGEPGDANRGRGATSIKDAARLSYTLTSMSDKERDLSNVTPDEQRRLVRLDSAKVNIVPPAGETRWFRLVGVALNNGTSDYPNGDEVQTVEPWTPSTALSKITVGTANAILDDIDRGLDNGSRYSAAPQAGKRAASLVVQKHVPDLTPEQAKQVIKGWVGNGILRVDDYVDPDRREKRKGLFANDDKRPGGASSQGLKDVEI